MASKRAFLAPPLIPSRALDRVRNALCADPRCGDDFPETEAEVVILQVVGRCDQITAKVEEIKKRGQKFAIIQFVLRSTQKPYVINWLPVWDGAQCVWSYLDLRALAVKDNVANLYDECMGNFYHAPLGVDGKIFTMQKKGPHTPLKILTQGRSWLTESVREVTLAAQALKLDVAHLGPAIGHSTCPVDNLPDSDLATLYGLADYVSGLRRVEGFELPAAEALMCGTRPLLFDAPHYRDWYSTWAEYLVEGSRQSVQDQLVALFKKPVRTVTQAERDAAAKVFSWSTVVSGFLDRCLA